MKASKRIKIVVDTNILISFFCYPGGIIRELMKKILALEYELVLSNEIVDEFKEVINKKFNELTIVEGEFIKFIQDNFTIINPEKKLNIVKDDATDNKIIECAVAAKADFIISGDKHILDLRKYKNIKILNPSDFLKMAAL